MEITVSVTNRVCTITSVQRTLICDNSGDTIRFTFDSEWDDDPIKTVYFIRGICGDYSETLMESNSVEVPVLTRPGTLFVGVQSGSIRTTRDVSIPVEPSIQTLIRRPVADPPRSIVEQIMDELNAIADQYTNTWKVYVEDELPEEPELETIYLIPDDEIYLEYFYDDRGWHQIGGGSSEGSSSDDLIALIAAVNALTNGKVDKVTGKGLSTNDYTDADKEKLAGLQNYTLPTATTEDKGGVKLGSGFSTENDVLQFTETDPTVPSWAKNSTKPSYTAEEVHALPENTTIPAPVEKEVEMTQPVGMDSNGRLWTAPGSGNVSVSYDADTGDLTITSTGSGSSVVYDDATGNLQIG